MNQKDWVEQFKVRNNRLPDPQEYSTALENGEFDVENTEGNQIDSVVNPNAQNYFNGDVRAIKSHINGLDNQIVQALFNLGLSYYDMVLNHRKEDLKPAVDTIIDLQKSNYDYKQVYNRLVVTDKSCLSCGAMLSNQDKFCSVCGSDVQQLEMIELNNRQICPTCNIEQSGKNKFCACCGFEFIQGNA